MSGDLSADVVVVGGGIAGGGYATRLTRFEEWIPPDEAESQAIPLDRLLPDVPGSLNVGHPEACEALVGAAEAAGAGPGRCGSVRFHPPRKPFSMPSECRDPVG